MFYEEFGPLRCEITKPVRTVEYYDVASGMYIIYLNHLYTVFTVRFKFFRHVD